ncbi:MAG: type II toxin-antitoxin system VapC family toxin [Gemmatimonadota bacterium]|nr:type II toxin-antitoxin system VapC family toxin [Gemmatimonadota bacterium]
MVIDTSALIAIMFREEEAEAMVRALLMSESRIVGTPTLVEAAAVMVARKGPGGEIALDALLERLDITVEPFSQDAARLARLAYGRFGKGVGSPGILNYGDCLAYGMAMARGESLLCKGEDFARTDVQVAAY